MQLSSIKLHDRHLAYAHLPTTSPAHRPAVMFCGGFKSSMQGQKALAFEAFCRSRQLAYTRFDYSGHGSSDGQFEQGDIGIWFEDALCIFDKVAQAGKTNGVIVIGSSMGAWIATLLARQRSENITGLITLAAAPDFTEKLLLPALSASQKDALSKGETIHLPSDYDDGSPYPIRQSLIEQSKKYCILDDNITLDMPVRLIHGTGDKDVPYSLSVRLMEAIQSDDCTLTLIKDADHRLSSDLQIKKITDLLGDMIA